MRSFIVAILTVVAVVAGCGAPAATDGPDGSEDFARSVDIGGRNIFLTCQARSAGATPTVVLISGYHNSSDVWIRDDVLSLHPPASSP